MINHSDSTRPLHVISLQTGAWHQTSTTELGNSKCTVQCTVPALSMPPSHITEWTLWTLCWLPGIKTLEKAQLPPHQLKRRWSECCFPHQLDKIINHPRSTAINYLFFLYLLFGTPFFSVLRFENIKSGNCYFWANLSKKNSQGTLQCRNIINGTKPSQVALREVIIMQESCRLKCA